RYARRYRDFVAHVRTREWMRCDDDRVARVVARNAYKLMAYKDEYEVARLYTNGEWEKSLRAAFAGKFKVHFHLAPPLLAGPKDGARPRKMRFGFWMFAVMKGLAALKGLRETPFDPFGASADRKLERRLRDDYETEMRALADGLTSANHATALALAE